MDIDKLQGDMWELRASSMATQSLLMGLILALKSRDTPVEVFNSAFDFATEVATQSAMQGQSARTLAILSQLQELFAADGQH